MAGSSHSALDSTSTRRPVVPSGHPGISSWQETSSTTSYSSAGFTIAVPTDLANRSIGTLLTRTTP